MMNLLDESSCQKLVNLLANDPTLLLVEAAHNCFTSLEPTQISKAC